MKRKKRLKRTATTLPNKLQDIVFSKRYPWEEKRWKQNQGTLERRLSAVRS